MNCKTCDYRISWEDDYCSIEIFLKEIQTCFDCIFKECLSISCDNCFLGYREYCPLLDMKVDTIAGECDYLKW